MPKSNATYMFAQESDPFLRAYLQAAICTESDAAGNPLDKDPHADGRLDPGSYAAMALDCKAFKASLPAFAELVGDSTAGLSQAGHDFWLTRNRHGCGFNDGDWDEPSASLLTEAAHAMGEVSLYEGDDGQIYYYHG